MNKDIAIKVENVSKTFRIPHEKITSLRGAFVNAFSKNKGYEEFQALDNVTFEVKKGEFFGIIGRNGSGKSTLLKILAGIYQPDKVKVHPVKSGEAGPAKREFHGVRVNGLISPFLELGIGFNPELSGRDNVFLNASVLGLTHKQIEEKFDDIVEFSELRRFIDQKVKNYSSGMQVRLAFSVAIHANRDVLLMDEVLAVGDTNFQSKCITEFSKYKDQGKTVVLVTHDIGIVQRYCDRAMLLRNGKIEIVGEPEKVSNEYIYQNMSDEERRTFEEERRKRGVAEKGPEDSKNKVAEITRVEFLDKDGSEKNVFETGDDMSIRVYFKINKIKEYFSYGLGLYNQEGVYITGIHSIFERIDYKKYLDKGFFQIDFQRIALKEGAYYIKASIGGKFIPPFYDYLDKSNLFKITSTDRNKEGLLKLQYRWN